MFKEMYFKKTFIVGVFEIFSLPQSFHMNDYKNFPNL